MLSLYTQLTPKPASYWLGFSSSRILLPPPVPIDQGARHFGVYMDKTYGCCPYVSHSEVQGPVGCQVCRRWGVSCVVWSADGPRSRTHRAPTPSHNSKTCVNAARSYCRQSTEPPITPITPITDIWALAFSLGVGGGPLTFLINYLKYVSLV